MCNSQPHTTERTGFILYYNTTARNKIVCGVIKRIFDCSDTSCCA